VIFVPCCKKNNNKKIVGMMLLASIIGQSAEILNQMISVERVLEFGNLAPEAPLNKNLTKTWTAPGEAMVKFMCKTSQ
jgi:hypothetical protein